MIPKATEDTITNLLAKELERYGVKAETFPTISTPGGIRKPDIWCVNAGAYPLEAKFRERDLIDAIAKVQNDYIRWYDVLGIKGGFALLYPEKLTERLPPDIVAELAYKVKFKAVVMFPPKDTRKNFTVYEGALPDIAKILAEHILTPPEYVEPSTDYIIKALREAAMYITLTLKYLSGKELEDLLGGREVFKNILQYEEEKYPIETLRLASAYILINQLLFYHVLLRRMPERFPEIDADRIKRPADLNEYFKKILSVNYKTIFSYDVASRILSGFTDQVKAVISVIKGLGPEKVGGDLLGTIFHDLVPFEVRKSVAAFYTNVLAAELLAWLSIDNHEAKVADLAVGSGGLLVAAYRRKRHLLEREGKVFAQADHRRFLEEQLLGIDVMPFAANVAACHLALQSPQYFTNKVNVAIWDSTELLPGKTIPSIASLRFVLKGQTGLEMFAEPETRAKGVVSLTGEIPEEIKLETYDVVIMNPPFTRHERMPKDYKGVLLERFKDYKRFLHGQMGYFGYFILLADRFLRKNGKMALVLPATALHVRSSEGIRRLWSENYHVEYIITTWHRLAFSESVVFREILLVAKKAKPGADMKTKICVLKKLPYKMSQAREIAEKIKTIEHDWDDEDLTIKIYPYSKLAANTIDWHKYIALSDLKLADLLDELLSSKKFVPLSSLAEAQECDLRHYKFKNFHGFILSDAKRIQRKSDTWFLDKIKERSLVARHRKLIHKVEIPLSCVRRGLRRFSYLNNIDVGNQSDYLILQWFDGVKEMARYMLPVNDLKLFDPKVVESWARKFERKKAHLLFARRLYLSSPGTCLLAFYSDKPTVGVDLWTLCGLKQAEAKVLALWLNSTFNILQLLYLGVACEGPWMKLHDYMFDRLLVPDPIKLTKKDITQLLEVFEKVRNVAFPSIPEQLRKKIEARKSLDKIWLKILRYKGDPDELLNTLYSSVIREIEIIDRLMHVETHTK
jgi:type I restriction-modification system DNA methylase subunit